MYHSNKVLHLVRQSDKMTCMSNFSFYKIWTLEIMFCYNDSTTLLLTDL